MLKVVVDDLTKTRPKLKTDLIRFALLQYKINIADSLMKFKIPFFVFFLVLFGLGTLRTSFLSSIRVDLTKEVSKELSCLTIMF